MQNACITPDIYGPLNSAYRASLHNAFLWSFWEFIVINKTTASRCFQNRPTLSPNTLPSFNLISPWEVSLATSFCLKRYVARTKFHNFPIYGHFSVATSASQMYQIMKRTCYYGRGRGKRVGGGIHILQVLLYEWPESIYLFLDSYIATNPTSLLY